MSTITVKTKVPENPSRVYSVVGNMENFPSFMTKIKSLKVIWKIPPNRQISAWEVDIGGVHLHWKEEDTFIESEHLISFRMLEGDFASFSGRWIVEPHEKNTTLILEATFDWGIPILGKFAGKALESKATAYLRGMLFGIRQHLNIDGRT